jgi:gamma-glutamylcyclotransferase (GGCT)/AIG2-like uncharacterized protein YtfP
MSRERKYSLFVYGTLMWQEVLRTVIGRTCPMEEALLDRYKRCRIKGAFYHGLRQVGNSTVKGRVIRGLSKRDLAMIDRVEGDAYKRIRVRVRTPVHGDEEVFTYIIKEAYLEILVDQEWHETDLSVVELRRLLHEEVQG